MTNPQRLMKPLIRKPGLPKGVNVDPANPYTHFREATWDEALDFAAKGLAQGRRAAWQQRHRRFRLGQVH